MALDLKLTYSQSNDAVRIKFTDATGEYNVSTNETGWGTPNADTSDIVSSTTTTSGKYHLILRISVQTSDLVTKSYDDLDLYSEFTSEFSKSYGMEFTLTPDMLIESGVAMGLSTDAFNDGIYTISYILNNADNSTLVDRKQYTLLVEGKVRKALYTKSAYIPDIYNCKVFNSDEYDWKSIVETLGIYSIFQGMLANPELNEVNDKLNVLSVLERLLDM
jgi:hypothetical protein